MAGTLTAVAVFSTGFNTFITDFLLFMLIWIAPWVSIYLTDYFMRRGRYDSRALLDTGPGIYFRRGGADLSVFMGALFGGATYWLLNRRPVAVQVDETDPLAEVAAATGAA
ncbi:MAG TPA: hypothetical protein VFW09_10170 [Solirubrobacteraceae bacterium]|nr:hypothetical protein [Solirubrobacteraceae bacterium]